MKSYKYITPLVAFIIVFVLFLLFQMQPSLQAGPGTPTASVFLPYVTQLEAIPTPSSTPTPTPSTNDLAILSDQFEDDIVDGSWTIFNASDFSYDEYGGQLHMVPSHFVVWFKRSNGPFLYKLVDGDFKLTARVITNNTASSPVVQFGGIMMRDPDSDDPDPTSSENYVFNVVGKFVNALAVEIKSTVADASYVEKDIDWNDASAELQICRLGANFYLYKRHIGETSWTLERSFNRPDIGSTVQAGMIAYAQNNTPDLDAGFEYIEFSRISSLDDCTTD
ncbi:MAG: DUF1349 domain-containing protein [Chloroflexi bacterium]|nr:DUF1349 domain-containing protein [Chloroflexota bacterium]